MNVTLRIPARLARDVIAGAMSLYWLDCYRRVRVRPDGNGLYIGPPVPGGDADGDDRIPAPRAFVGARAIAAGLVAMLESGKPSLAQCAARVLSEAGDGPDMDVVLQFAAYGGEHWG